jgi:hypothetical protein
MKMDSVRKGLIDLAGACGTKIAPAPLGAAESEKQCTKEMLRGNSDKQCMSFNW